LINGPSSLSGGAFILGFGFMEAAAAWTEYPLYSMKRAKFPFIPRYGICVAPLTFCCCPFK